MVKCIRNGALGDLVKHHAANSLSRDVGSLQQMPCDSFAFAIGVSGEIDLFSICGRGLQIFDDVLLVIRHAILRCKASLDVNRELGAQQITHMSDGCAHVVVPTEIPTDRPCLGRRLDDH